MNILQGLFTSLHYWIHASKEILLWNSLNNAYIRSNVIYDVPQEQTNNSYLTLDKKDIVEIDYKDIKTIPSQFYEKKIYAILYDDNKNEIISRFSHIIYNPHYITFLINRPIYLYVIKFISSEAPTTNNKQAPYIFKLYISEAHWFVFPSAIVGVIILFIITQNICKSIIYNLATLEPNFNDFIIKNTVMSLYKDISDKSEDHCFICYEEYMPNSNVRKLHCNHYFHDECIDRWLLSRQHYCPCCRKKVIIQSKY